MTSPSSATPARQPRYAGAVVYRDVPIPMRDGIHLATDIYLPAVDGRAAATPFPLLVVRTPYSKQSPAMPGRPSMEQHAVRAAQHGFAVACQDTRGRYQSPGRFRSMQDDGPDGWDTLAWLGQQPWCTGEIGMLGVSYLAAVQMMLAPLRPPQLRAAFSEQPASDEFTDRTFHAGALTLANVEGWAVNACGEQYTSRLSEPLQARAKQELAEYRALGPKALDLLPLRDVPWLRLYPDIWQQVLDHVEDPTFFQANDVRSKLDQISIPIYHLGGWFDPFLRNTIDHYKGAAAAAANQRLIIGAWTHGAMSASSVGEVTFPDAAFDDFGYALGWHDRWLRDGPGLAAQEHPVIVYVMGANRWRAEEAWPLPGTEVTSYFLEPSGSLSTSPPTGESWDVYDYDPDDPAPTPPEGRTRVTSLLDRSDALVYATEPLEEAVEVTGDISATLYAASSAEDTDFMLRLVDIDVAGDAWHVVDGIVRTRYRHSRVAPTPITPGEVERYDINLWATSLVFQRGHRIAVVVSSSNFPKYDRHPNVYADLSTTTQRDFRPARQTIQHSTAFPSAVHLPIVSIQEHQAWIPNPLPYDSRVYEVPPAQELPASTLPDRNDRTA
jgi:putative CocE/NonD family hydrolase